MVCASILSLQYTDDFDNFYNRWPCPPESRYLSERGGTNINYLGVAKSITEQTCSMLKRTMNAEQFLGNLLSMIYLNIPLCCEKVTFHGPPLSTLILVKD